MDRGRVILPAMRLSRLHEAVRSITGDAEIAQRVMGAVDEHIEVGAYRWGNACAIDGCGKLLTWNDGGWFICADHGAARHVGTIMLVGFLPLGSRVG